MSQFEHVCVFDGSEGRWHLGKNWHEILLFFLFFDNLSLVEDVAYFVDFPCFCVVIHVCDISLRVRVCVYKLSVLLTLGFLFGIKASLFSFYIIQYL